MPLFSLHRTISHSFFTKIRRYTVDSSILFIFKSCARKEKSIEGVVRRPVQVLRRSSTSQKSQVLHIASAVSREGVQLESDMILTPGRHPPPSMAPSSLQDGPTPRSKAALKDAVHVLEAAHEDDLVHQHDIQVSCESSHFPRPNPLKISSSSLVACK